MDWWSCVNYNEQHINLSISTFFQNLITDNLFLSFIGLTGTWPDIWGWPKTIHNIKYYKVQIQEVGTCILTGKPGMDSVNSTENASKYVYSNGRISSINTMYNCKGMRQLIDSLTFTLEADHPQTSLTNFSKSWARPQYGREHVGQTLTQTMRTEVSWKYFLTLMAMVTLQEPQTWCPKTQP